MAKKNISLFHVRYGSVAPCYAIIPNIAVIYNTRGEEGNYNQYGLHLEWLGKFITFSWFKTTREYAEFLKGLKRCI